MSMEHAIDRRRAEPTSSPTSRAPELVATGPDTRRAWIELARTAPSVSPAQTPEWLDCMCSVTPYEDASRLYETADGRRILVPLVRYRRLPRGAALEASLPHAWDYAGPLASGGLRPDDVAGLAADRSHRLVIRTTLRALVSDEESRAWTESTPPGTWIEAQPSHVLDLSGGFEAVWSERFSSKVRSASRKATRRGVRIESDTTGRLVPAFTELYRKSIDRWAADRREPIRLRRLLAARHAPGAAFAAAATRLGPACRVWIASRDDRPIAGIMVITHGDQALYWKGAMDKELVIGTGATELLHCRAIEAACEDGVRAYHMGPHVDRYKRTFGTGEMRALELRFETLPLSRAERAVRGAVMRAAQRRS